MIFISVCTYTNDNYWQSTIFLALSMITSAYLYAIFPFKYSKKNYIENLNELIIFFCAVFQMILAGYTMDTTVGSDTKGKKK